MMHRKIRSLAFAAMLVGINVLAAEIALQDFFSQPAKTDFTLSPDGQTIAWLAPWQSRSNIMISQAGGPGRRVTAITDRDLYYYFWKGNRRLVYLKDDGGDENFHVYRVDLASGTTTDLTPFPGARVNVIDQRNENDDDILIESNKRDPHCFDAYRLDLSTGQLTLLALNPGNVQGWLADHDGRIRVAQTDRGPVYRKDEHAGFETLEALVEPTDKFIPLFFAMDNKHLYVSSNVDRDKQALVEYDPDTRKEIKVLYANPEVDVGDLNYSLLRQVLTCSYFQVDLPQRVCFDSQKEQLLNKLEARLPGVRVDIVSGSRDESRVIVQAWSDRLYSRMYLYDQSKDTLQLLSDLKPELQEAEMASMRPVQYQSRDGLTIHGYLTLPLGKEQVKGLPVIINPHGGPWSRDYWGFNPEVQFFASRGWAVLQMNFRGSTGYGRKFLAAGAKEWGGDMQDDITDGVNWLIKTGIADPQRICIYGASYGGFAALSGITKTPDLYRCAIDYAGISNLFTYLDTYPPYWQTEAGYISVMVGSPKRDWFMLRRRSPINHTDSIKTPLLVLHGAKDPRVKIDEAKQIVGALKKRNVDVEFIVKDNEGHGFQNEENRIEAYQAMARFFHRYLDVEAGPHAASEP